MDPITIITVLLPLLAKCWGKQTAQNPQEHLKANYDAATGKMSPSLVNAAIPATRRAVAKSKQQLPRNERKSAPRYTRDELYDLAEKGLVEAMNADSTKVAAVYSAAMQLGDAE